MSELQDKQPKDKKRPYESVMGQVASKVSWLWAFGMSYAVIGLVNIHTVAHLSALYISYRVHKKKSIEKKDALFAQNSEILKSSLELNSSSSLLDEAQKAIEIAGIDPKTVNVRLLQPDIAYLKPIAHFKGVEGSFAKKIDLMIPASTYLPLVEGGKAYFSEDERVMLLSEALSDCYFEADFKRNVFKGFNTANVALSALGAVTGMVSAAPHYVTSLIALGASAVLGPLVYKHKILGDLMRKDHIILKDDDHAVGLAKGLNKLRIVHAGRTNALSVIPSVTMKFNENGSFVQIRNTKVNLSKTLVAFHGGEHKDYMLRARFNNIRSEIRDVDKRKELHYSEQDTQGAVFKSLMDEPYFPLLTSDAIKDAYKRARNDNAQHVVFAFSDNSFLKHTSNPHALRVDKNKQYTHNSFKEFK
jgi:hypothetical protein